MIIESMKKDGEMLHSIAPFSFEKIRSNKERPNLKYHEKHSANIIKKNDCREYMVLKTYCKVQIPLFEL